MALLGLLVAVGLVAPQEQAPFVVVSGARHASGALPMAAFGLGDGGLSDAGARLALAPGDVLSPGGIRVRARAEGVKLDFPSGAELLVTPSLRLCLRDGAQSLPVLGRLVLALADGSLLELEPDGGGRRPLRRATLVHGNVRQVFWPPQQAVLVEAGMRRDGDARTTAARTDAYLVLGDGRCVYRAVAFGPLLGLRAVLLPRDEQRLPPARIVVAGDVLAASLQRLPAHVPPHPVQFPQAPEAAQRLATLANVLFAPGMVERSARARGPLVLALPREWRLRCDLGQDPGFATLGLYRADATVPAVEWTINRARTELRLVRPFGGENGSPRYFLRGLDLTDEVRALWPGRPGPEDLRWLDQTLAHLGGRGQAR
ncbi:MAG: hypothetical protein R3F56_09825 [Planctomycetota bacterium]